MDLKQASEELASLYTVTGLDWHLRIGHILTEPTCPTIVIAPEGWQMLRYSIHTDPDQVMVGLEKLVNLIKAEIFERKLHSLESPALFSNPDDKEFASWLLDRSKGNNDKLSQRCPAPPSHQRGYDV